jgi:hypothetical protein
VRAEAVQEIEEEINAWAVETKSCVTQAMRDLWIYLAEKPHSFWTSGRVPGLHEAPFLLSFLRQLSQQGWKFAECVPLSREKTFEDEVRGVWLCQRAASASRQSGLEGQQSGEHPDPMHFLSSLLARHAHTAWADTHAAYAETAHPLAHGARSRVGRLRGYGNAINAEAAIGFIEAYLETEADRHLRLNSVSLSTTDTNLQDGIFS